MPDPEPRRHCSDSFPVDVFDATIRSFAGCTATMIAVVDPAGRRLGNNGDSLMRSVASRLVASRGVRITHSADQKVDAAFVEPNGALVESYRFPDYLASTLTKFRTVPLVLLPSSAWFPSVDPSIIFRGRSAEATLMLRDPLSYEHLCSDWGEQLADAGVRLELSHDVVVLGRDILPKVIGNPTNGRYTLVAARHDAESMLDDLAIRRHSTGRVLLKRLFRRLPIGTATYRVTRSVFDVGSRRRHRELQRQSYMALREIEKVPARTIAKDVSNPKVASYHDYKTLVRNAGLVITNRLHVALPAAYLDKPVILHDTGYHKLRGAYEHSMRRLPNVHFVPKTPV